MVERTPKRLLREKCVEVHGKYEDATRLKKVKLESGGSQQIGCAVGTRTS